VESAERRIPAPEAVCEKHRAAKSYYVDLVGVGCNRAKEPGFFAAAALSDTKKSRNPLRVPHFNKMITFPPCPLHSRRGSA
jgi:hypothetical protein